MSRLLISQYQAEVEKIVRYGGSRKETSIRVAFQNLLNEYCKARDFLLIPELDYRTKSGKLVYPDGTVKDALRLDWGYWESKDEYDNLNEEIEKKLGKGYPDDNILFEDSQTAVLIQQGEEQLRVSMRDDGALDGIINAFINYVRPEVEDFRQAINSFKEDLPTILEALRDLIARQSEANPNFVQARDKFLEICQQSINPEISSLDVREMVIQHILTEDIFISIFNESQFHQENNVARELQEVISTFFTGSTKRNTLGTIERYYAVIRRTAANIYNHQEKQKFLKAVYENFYKAYNPKAADRLGIVYTPNEIVRFMIESVDYLVHKHFGKLLADSGVEILDPATGTGTFVTELIEYLPKDKLRYKYKNEIHCNEVAILPYYIANLNIEFTYKQKMGEYEEFDHICFVDTLDHAAFHLKQMDLFAMSVENTERIKNQNDRTISVIIGNPPYNAKQENFNQDNANRSYEAIDKRIKDTYIREGTAQNQIVIYDMYTRFIRWASDRLNKNGVVAFVSNNSFIDALAYDGFRKVIAQEFNEIWIIDAKGNARNSGERRRREGGNVFSDKIKVGIAVYFLVRNQQTEGFKIFYNAIKDYTKAEEKQEYFLENTLEKLSFEHIIPDKKHIWLNQSDNDFDELLPLIDKDVKSGKSEEAVFKLFSRGIVTQRDEWVYDFSRDALEAKMKFLVDVYQKTFEDEGYEEKNEIKWDRELTKYLAQRISKTFDDESILVSYYRPYIKQWLYFDRHFNGMTYQWYGIYKNEEAKNRYIIIPGLASPKNFYNLASSQIIDLNCLPAGCQCLPFYHYDKEGNRIDNITDWGLQQFRNYYREKGLGNIPDEMRTRRLSALPSPDTSGETRGLSALPSADTSGETRGLSPLPSADTSGETRGLSPLSGSPLFESQGLWFVTFVTHNSRISERMVTYGVKVGEPLVFSGEDQIFIAQKISEAGKRYNIAIVAFNVLPDHVHMIIAAKTEKELGESVRKIKGYSSYEFQQSRNWDKGQHVWAQKFNRQVIEDESALTEILNYVWNNHLKHTERWGESLISIWENGLLNKGLKPLVEIVRDGCVSVEEALGQTRRLSALSNIENSALSNSDSALPNSNTSEGTRGLSPLSLAELTANDITKLDIFYYTYAVLHNPAYRTKYELNLKRDFPRLPFYDNFYQWVEWGHKLMDLHINYETVEPYPLTRVDANTNLKPKTKLKADKEKGYINLDDVTFLQDIPKIAWEYKLGNRSALEWILDQYKEKKPKDKTIAEKFNTYCFADYKEKVIDLLQRICTVSVETMKIIQAIQENSH